MQFANIADLSEDIALVLEGELGVTFTWQHFLRGFTDEDTGLYILFLITVSYEFLLFSELLD